MTPAQPTRARRARFVAACLATLALALAACSSTSPSASPSASRTIHLFVRPGTEQRVHVGSLTGCSLTTLCQGDLYVGEDPLTDAATNRQVGTLLFECFVIDVDSSLYHCPANTIELSGRGQIVFSEQVYHDQSNRPAAAPITGGTGEFLGATGTVITRSSIGQGEFEITLTK